MDKELACKIEVQGIWTSESYSAFQMLYVPLIGNEAAILYHTLLSIALRPKKIKNHRLICEISGLSMEAIEKHRVVLEQYLLLKTFYNADKNCYLYEIFMPKTGNDFLRHEVFGRLYMKKMGEKVYQFNKLCFANDYEDKSGYQDITIPFVNVLKGQWAEKEEESFRNMKPKQQELYQNDIPLSFNYDRFLAGITKTIFPESQRSEQNLRLIGELATIHGIDEQDMIAIVNKAVDVKSGKLRIELLKKLARAAKSKFEVLENQDPYRLPPVVFLQNKQHGVEVSRSDKFLIESLIRDYHMQPEVVNVLIEYVLDTKKQQFPKAYVEKVAATWVRLGIDTAEKARKQIQEEQANRKSFKASREKKLPSWYHDQSDISNDTEDFNEEEMLELQKRLRGE